MNQEDKKKRDGLFAEIGAIPPILKDSHLASLDGFRAVSIIMVIIFHVLISYKTRFSFFNFANLGVQFFFVISGFLITTLLLKEKIVKGDISLRNFYVRRFFRIIPVAYLYLSVVVVLDLVLHLHMKWIFLVGAFLFIRNFIPGASGIDHLSTHYWSLSVEEQFYVLFPFILKKNFRVYVWFLLGIMATAVLLDCLSSFAHLNFEEGTLAGFLTVAIIQFTSIAIGSLTSILLFKTNFSFRQKNKTALNIGLVLAIIGLNFFYTAPFHNTINILKCGCFALLLVANLTVSDNAFFRLLNSGPMKLIGVLSYSMYIWQQPLTQGLTTLNKSSLLSRFPDKLPVDIAITLVSLPLLGLVSYLSYFYFEKTFLKLRERFR